MQSKTELLHGWGRTPTAECSSWRPEKQREVRSLLRNIGGVVVPRGLGRSYGDATLQPQGVIRTERLDHFISFDEQSGVVHLQAGVSLKDLMAFSIPRGFIPPVLPGTRHVTVAGAFACNVHGKNHFRDGDFAEHVRSIRLLTADGNVLECSPSEHGDLFWATAGGMGMTGIIEEITIALKPIESTSLKTTSYRVNSIEDMVAAFEGYRDVSDYMVGWIDHMAKDDDIGRGVFEAASHINVEEGGEPCQKYVPAKKRFSVPCFMPPFILNRYSMAIYNKLRFKKYDIARKSEIAGFNDFFHPLDSIGNWYKLYGKRGFFQYQCLIPESPDVVDHLHSFLSMLHKHRMFSYLAVIKYHREGKGMLTFPLRGYSIALDFPNTAHVRKLIPQINDWISEHGGRVYLAKDALLNAQQFHHMYNVKAQNWQTVLRDIDPNARFASLMSERLGWKAWPGQNI